jgi:hypothetical protein
MYPKEPELGAVPFWYQLRAFFGIPQISGSMIHRCQLLMEMMYKRLEPNALAYDLGIDACEASWLPQNVEMVEPRSHWPINWGDLRP